MVEIRLPSGPALLTIGEFARRSGLSIRARRLYDRYGADPEAAAPGDLVCDVALPFG